MRQSPCDRNCSSSFLEVLVGAINSTAVRMVFPRDLYIYTWYFKTWLLLYVGAISTYYCCGGKRDSVNEEKQKPKNLMDVDER